MIHVPLPDAFARRVEEVHGESGHHWLSSLPGLVAGLADRWGLEVGEPVADPSYNLVVKARQGDRQMVLKLGVPNRELNGEVAALRLFDGRGAVRLFESDVALGALLLERLIPGTSLWKLDDEITAPIVATVMQRLWRRPPPGHSFASVDDWSLGFTRLRTRFGGTTGPLPAAGVERAERTIASRNRQGDVVLHGDLHHGNVLSAGRQWLAIDPKGVVGPRELEAGPYLRNPINDVLTSKDPARRLKRRIAILSEALGMDPDAVLVWAHAQAMLSAWWTIEDHGTGADPTVKYASHLMEITFP